MDLLNLHRAILKADFSLARRLIESGTTVNSRDAEGRTPLMLCCLHDGETWSLGVARMLLIHGGRVGLCDRRGRTALMYAVRYERPGLVALFLQALDYDLNHIDKHGHMALWYAARVGNGPIYDRLLKAMGTGGMSTDAFVALRLCGHKQDQILVKHQVAVEQNGTISAADQKVSGHTKPRPGNDPCLLFQKEFPYKPIPAHCWTKRENLCKTVKQPQVKPETKKPSPQEFKQCTEAKTTTSTSTEWKVDLATLTEAFRRQLSLSYRPGAQPRPPSTTRPCRRKPRLGASPSAQTLIRERWRRGRKMSLDTISDSLLKEKATVGAFRRRCSLSVMPVIRLRTGPASHTSNSSGLNDVGEGRKSQS